MKRGALILLFSLFSLAGIGQNLRDIKSKEADVEFENTHVLPLFSDSLSASFLIWVKKSVPKHYHKYRTEHIYVIEGEGLMLLGTDTLLIKEGSHVLIKPTTPHAVWVKSAIPLKVLSIQSPFFDGSDRHFLD